MTAVWIVTLFFLWLALVGVDHQTARANRAEGEADEWRRRHNDARADLFFARLDGWRNGIANECNIIEGDFTAHEPTPMHDEVAVRRFRRQLDEGRQS